jgi:signal transduction histidine kinase
MACKPSALENFPCVSELAPLVNAQQGVIYQMEMEGWRGLKLLSAFAGNGAEGRRQHLSILILGQQLGDNPESNLTPRQAEFARTIHGVGTDLLNLISDIRDLSKIESGTVSVDVEEIFFTNLLDMMPRPSRYEAKNRRLSFEVQVDRHLSRSLVTDSKRL